MFGYVKPYAPELRVKSNETYRALYCGLCRVMGKLTGQLSRFSLSYDFVFLTAVRLLATEEKLIMNPSRCAIHPLKKHLFAEENEALRYSAAVSAVLLRGKIEDDIADEKFFSSLKSRAAYPLSKGMVKRTGKLDSFPREKIITSVAENLKLLAALEAESSDSLDETSEKFGVLTGEMFSAGLEGAAARISYEIGRSVGRFIYITDAADDLLEDVKNNRYNPIFQRYGENATETREGRVYLSKNVADELYCALRLDLGRCSSAVELLCEGRDAVLSEIVKNTVYLGLPEKLRTVLVRAVGKAEGELSETI